MNFAWLLTPLASRVMLFVVVTLVGALGIGWWSHTATVSRLTKERNEALESVGVLRNDNDKLVLAIETQNGVFIRYQATANALLSASAASLTAAIAAGQVLAGANQTLRARVLPTAPDAACKAADALILEFAK